MKLDVHHLACHLKHQHVEKKTVKQKGTVLATTPKHTPELTNPQPKRKGARKYHKQYETESQTDLF
jgi:hypothetical protein